jgi:hypothetical protein
MSGAEPTDPAGRGENLGSGRSGCVYLRESLGGPLAGRRGSVTRWR